MNYTTMTFAPEDLAQVPLLERINSVKGTWAVRFAGLGEGELIEARLELGRGATPTLEQIKAVVLGWHDEQINKAILSGFEYQGAKVWLSSENQFNYKAAYDLAVQMGGATLPLTFKFGTADTPVYHQFTILEELTDFYTKSLAYVQATLTNGWMRKDKIDWSPYNETFRCYE